MLPPRRISTRFCLIALLYGLLVLPWPGVRAAYAACFRAGANAIFRSAIPGGTVRLRPMPKPKGHLDTYLRLENLESGETRTFMTSSQKPGYLSTALLVSLVLVTPHPWRRRLWALLWGLLLVSVFVGCETFIIVLHPFCAGELALFGPPSPWDRVLAVSYNVVTGGVVTWFIVPVFVWGLVCFRQADWENWVRSASSDRCGVNR